MKKYLFIISYLMCLEIVEAQTWQRLIDNPFNFGGAEAYGIRVIDDTIYVSSVFIVTDTVSNDRAVISKHSLEDGELLDFSQYRNDTLRHSLFNDLGTGFNQLYETGDSNFYMPLVTWNDNTSNLTQTRCLIIDKQLQVLNDYPVLGFTSDLLQNFNGTRIDADGNILLYGSRSRLGNYFEGDSANTLLVKMTPQGEQLWTRRFNDCFTINFCEPLADGDIILNAGEVGTVTNNKFLIKANENGDELWRIHYGGVYTGPLSAVLETSDGKILAANGWNVSSSAEPGSDWWYRKWLQFQKITDLGTSYLIDEDVKYAPTRNVEEVFGIEEMSDGKFIAWGMMQSTAGDIFDTVNQIWTKPFTRAFLIKLDNNLDSLWMRTYYQPDDDWLQMYSQYRFTDVAPLDDGGFVTCGWGRIREEQNLEKVWLTRLDEYGCIEPGCQLVAVDEIVIGLENSMNVFPNPVSSVGNIKWSLANSLQIEKNFGNSTLIVTDITGREMHRQNLSHITDGQVISIDMNDYAAGLYIAHWVSGSTWLDSVQVVVE